MNDEVMNRTKAMTFRRYSLVRFDSELNEKDDAIHINLFEYFSSIATYYPATMLVVINCIHTLATSSLVGDLRKDLWSRLSKLHGNIRALVSGHKVNFLVAHSICIKAVCEVYCVSWPSI